MNKPVRSLKVSLSNAMHERPCAADGLTSYRLRTDTGWIMIGAKDDADAAREAKRSTSDVRLQNMDVWHEGRYVPVWTLRSLHGFSIGDAVHYIGDGIIRNGVIVALSMVNPNQATIEYGAGVRLEVECDRCKLLRQPAKAPKPVQDSPDHPFGVEIMRIAEPHISMVFTDQAVYQKRYRADLVGSFGLLDAMPLAKRRARILRITRGVMNDVAKSHPDHLISGADILATTGFIGHAIANRWNDLAVLFKAD